MPAALDGAEGKIRDLLPGCSANFPRTAYNALAVSHVNVNCNDFDKKMCCRGPVAQPGLAVYITLDLAMHAHSPPILMNKPPKKPVALQDITAAYEQVRPDFVRLTRKLESLLVDVMAARGLTYHLIESRTKDAKSVAEKVSRSSKSYSDPLRELTDISGVRIILNPAVILSSRADLADTKAAGGG
jgi:hypothetical protein